MSNNIFSNRYSITLPDGRILGQTSGATAALRKTAENTAKGFGRGFSEVGGILIGVGIANDWLRDNVKGVKDFEDSVRNAIVSGWGKVSTGIGNFFGGAIA